MQIRTTRKPLLAIGALLTVGLLFVAALAGSARSAPPVTVTPVPLARGTIADAFRIHIDGIKMKVAGPVDVAVADLTFPPGGTTGWHAHPGVTLVTVKRGTVTRILADGCTRESFHAGQGFVEKPNAVHMVRNEGTVPAETIVTFIVPVGAPVLAPEPAPVGCNPGGPQPTGRAR
jgi:quercetin dioxygenase-like cupin family protein